MKRYRIYLVALLFLIAMGGLIFVPSFSFARDQSAFAYRGTSVQRYHLSGALWQVQGASRGGGYQLFTQPLTPAGTGTQCCCTYLPCLLKKP